MRGLIFDNATIAQYFEKIFLSDWDNVAVGHRARMGVAVGAAATAQILGWQDDPGESETPLVPPELRPVPDLTLSPQTGDPQCRRPATPLLRSAQRRISLLVGGRGCGARCRVLAPAGPPRHNLAIGRYLADTARRGRGL
jgi:hypothetical protein